MTIVEDSYGAAADNVMSTIPLALDVDTVQREFARALPALTGEGARFGIDGIRVMRYKPAKRCLIEYALSVRRGDGSSDSAVLIGKIQAKRFGKSGLRTLQAFWQHGFDANAADGISVPEPMGHIGTFEMWLQRKSPGVVLTDMLTPQSIPLMAKVAEAAVKIHRSGAPTERRHGMADELRILRERLPKVAAAQPQLAARIDAVLDASAHLAGRTPEAAAVGIHRDFYPDQILLHHGRMTLIDFDLYCMGDPALDIGNFIGHLTEHSLRHFGRPDALADLEEALHDRFVALEGAHTSANARAYATLTLVRHIHLSTLLPERQAFTHPLLALCEQRLGIPCHDRRAVSA